MENKIINDVNLEDICGGYSRHRDYLYAVSSSSSFSVRNPQTYSADSNSSCACVNICPQIDAGAGLKERSAVIELLHR